MKKRLLNVVSKSSVFLGLLGSPFQFTVGPLKDGGAHRVHAGGPGLERGEQGQPCEFNVWTREAGAGSLAISVEGPSKAEIDFKDRKDGSCYVSYKVGTPGNILLYLLHLLLNNVSSDWDLFLNVNKKCKNWHFL